MLSSPSLFQKANQIAQNLAKEIECLALFQTGSLLRKKDFSPQSDVDLLVVLEKEPKHHWKHIYKQGIEISLLQDSDQRFKKNLKRGVPFELTAVNHGRILKGKKWVNQLSTRTYKPTRLTFKYKIQSALNHYVDLLNLPNALGECYNSIYHSYRESVRYLILHEVGKLVEGDTSIRQQLEAITPQRAKTFWELRENRHKSLNPKQVQKLDSLEKTLDHPLMQIESLGRKIFQIEGLKFPCLEKIKTKLKKKGYILASVSYARFLGRKKYITLTGKRKGTTKRKMYIFEMETGDLYERIIPTKEYIKERD